MFGGYSSPPQKLPLGFVGALGRLPTANLNEALRHTVTYNGLSRYFLRHTNINMQYIQSSISENIQYSVKGLLVWGYRVTARPLLRSHQVPLYVRGNVVGSDETKKGYRSTPKSRLIWST